MDIDRIKLLAGLKEAFNQVEDPDEEDRRDEERHAREAKISRVIAMAFAKIGLPIADDGIIYFEDDREASVVLDDFEIDLDVLIKLKTTGLSNKYEIHAGADHELRIEFIVVPEMDHVVLPGRRTR